MDRDAAPLTPRELQVLELLCGGAMTAEIALQLGIREATVQQHTANLKRKLQARTRAHAVGLALTGQLLAPDAVSAPSAG